MPPIINKACNILDFGPNPCNDHLFVNQLNKDDIDNCIIHNQEDFSDSELEILMAFRKFFYTESREELVKIGTRCKNMDEMIMKIQDFEWALEEYIYQHYNKKYVSEIRTNRKRYPKFDFHYMPKMLGILWTGIHGFYL